MQQQHTIAAACPADLSYGVAHKSPIASVGICNITQPAKQHETRLIQTYGLQYELDSRIQLCKTFQCDWLHFTSEYDTAQLASTLGG